MERSSWLAERRAAVVAEYDAEAPTYDEHDYPVPLHAAFVDRLVATCPPAGIILDAPCGTGRYFAQVAGAGRRLVGVDQSAGMLAMARARGLAERLEHVGLQELAFVRAFDAAMTIDAMENMAPEDWPAVVDNIRSALRPGGHWYLTVEEVDAGIVDAAFADLTARGLPVVHGEVVDGDVAGYHYYPGRERALGWLRDAGFALVDEAFDQQAGWGYRHLIVRAPG